MQNAVIHYDKRGKLYLGLCQRWQLHHPLCFSCQPVCLFERPSKAGRWVSPALKVLQSEDLTEKNMKIKRTISVFPHPIFVASFKNSLSSNHGRKTCRTAKWPQGIYVCFHDCNLTASKCRLKGCLCVPELSFVLALMAEGLLREPLLEMIWEFCVRSLFQPDHFPAATMPALHPGQDLAGWSSLPGASAACA